MIQPNNHMHSDCKKRRSSVALLFAAGDVKRYVAKLDANLNESGFYGMTKFSKLS